MRVKNDEGGKCGGVVGVGSCIGSQEAYVDVYAHEPLVLSRRVAAVSGPVSDCHRDYAISAPEGGLMVVAGQKASSRGSPAAESHTGHDGNLGGFPGKGFVIGVVDGVEAVVHEVCGEGTPTFEEFLVDGCDSSYSPKVVAGEPCVRRGERGRFVGVFGASHGFDLGLGELA